jgi:hypothetical protein
MSKKGAAGSAPRGWVGGTGEPNTLDILLLSALARHV